MTAVRIRWDRPDHGGESGLVVFEPTRRYWRDDTRVTDAPVPVRVTAGQTATADLDPTGGTWCYAVTWTPDGDALPWTEYVLVPAGLEPVEYRDLQRLTRDAAQLLTGEDAVTAAVALARVEDAGAETESAAETARRAAESANVNAAQAAIAADAATVSAETAATEAERATSAATTLNADATAFGDRVRDGEFQGDPGVIAVPAPGLPGVLEVIQADGSVTPWQAREDARATIAAAAEVERLTMDAAAHSSSAAIAAGWAERVATAAAAHAETVLDAVRAAVGELRALLPDGGGSGLVLVPRQVGVIAAASGVGVSALTRGAPGVVTLSTMSPDVTSPTRGVVTITNGVNA